MPADRPASAGSIGYEPALDGLRGLAIAGVLLFHGQRLRGGFLGVDAFFVLSGFLITSILLAEHRASGTVRLGGFWARRARRLLPALACLLLLAAVYAVLVARRTELAAIRGDAFATLAYVANWRQIVVGQDYFALFRAPSVLQHTWSLAIEEQFYLVWPLVVLGLTRGSPDVRPRAGCASLPRRLAVLSYGWAALLVPTRRHVAGVLRDGHACRGDPARSGVRRVARVARPGRRGGARESRSRCSRSSASARSAWRGPRPRAPTSRSIAAGSRCAGSRSSRSSPRRYIRTAARCPRALGTGARRPRADQLRRLPLPLAALPDGRPSPRHGPARARDQDGGDARRGDPLVRAPRTPDPATDRDDSLAGGRAGCPRRARGRDPRRNGRRNRTARLVAGRRAARRRVCGVPRSPAHRRAGCS